MQTSRSKYVGEDIDFVGQSKDTSIEFSAISNFNMFGVPLSDLAEEETEK